MKSSVFSVLLFSSIFILPLGTKLAAQEASTKKEATEKIFSAAEVKARLPDWIFEDWEFTPGFPGDLREPLDEEELHRLALAPETDRYRLKILICRAAAEKDGRFLYLLERADLREDPWFDLPIAAYDYSVNGAQSSLDYLLQKHALVPQGSDSDTILVFSFVDEWDKTVLAYLKHFENGTDGAGGISRTEFWKTRKQLFPEAFERFLAKFRQ